MKRYWSLLKTTYQEWDRDDSLRIAAALSYYTVFSISPLIILVIALSGLIFGEEAVRGELAGQLRGLMGDDGAKAVEDVIANARKPSSGIIATILGVIILIVGATAVFAELKAALNKIWKVEPQKEQGVMAIIRTRLLSFAMVLSIGFLLLVSLIINTVLAAASRYFSNYLDVSVGWLSFSYSIFSLLLVAVLFGLIFKFLPDVKIKWKDVWLGALLTSVFFTLGRYFIGLYLGQSLVASSFGASASVVIVMVWAYYSSSILLFGAEFVKVHTTAKRNQPARSFKSVRVRGNLGEGASASNAMTSSSVV